MIIISTKTKMPIKGNLTKLLAVSFLLLLKQEAKAEWPLIDTAYQFAYDSLSSLLASNETLSFKKAVFITENAFNDNSLSYQKFNLQIGNLVLLAKSWAKSNPLSDYQYPDSSEVNKNFAIYRVMKVSRPLITWTVF